ncbi:glycosyltransferase family 4 protein [Mailhella massiliensis]|uniref:Glycosyltransferase family 4 protein n=1 Tax=Mailhella massiliensis TaxID=1903261 RepID=A0A921DS78_9BACT|nr:glycosyltransferase family 4 protein [Mailhella massiliensis]HJD98269.1 glycosyltransferase family 4 protein [Mailhella massiliensis]
MRCIQVVNVRWYNATAWYGVTLAHCLQKAGHESLVAGLAGTPPLEKAKAMGLPTIALPFNTQSPVKLVELWRGMGDLVRSFRPDVVNCHRGEAFILWALMKRSGGFALVRTRGDRRLPRGGFVNRWLHCSAADAVIATNSLMARHFFEALHVPSSRLHTILGGVDTERFHADDAARQKMRQSYGYGEDDIVMGLLGRMDSVKGIKESIEALALARKLSSKAQRLRFLVIGFDSEFSTADVARWTREQGLGELGHVVTVTGKVEYPEAVISALDFGILASLGSEAIARAALEIMACGVPLISSTTGVMPDLVPGPYCFAPGDTQAMAERMVQALDEEWRSELAGICRERIFQGGLRLEDFLSSTLKVYEEAVRRT